MIAVRAMMNRAAQSAQAQLRLGLRRTIRAVRIHVRRRVGLVQKSIEFPAVMHTRVGISRSSSRSPSPFAASVRHDLQLSPAGRASLDLRRPRAVTRPQARAKLGKLQISYYPKSCKRFASPTRASEQKKIENRSRVFKRRLSSACSNEVLACLEINVPKETSR